jgi:hypothetical protein
MQFLVGIAEIVRILRKGFVLPNAVEAVLFRQRLRRWINIAYGLESGACDLVRGNADEWTVFFV